MNDKKIYHLHIPRTSGYGIANALEKLAKNAELRAQMGAAAKEFTLSNFGVDRLVLDHEKLYKKLLSNRAKS